MLSETLPIIIGALAVFIFSIGQLSLELRDALGLKAREIIAKYTKNLASSIFWGTLFTIALGSSSAVIIIAIIFVNSGTLSFRQAIGIVMGANIGTTFSSQLFSFELGKYAYIFLLIGLVLMLVAKSKAVVRNGKIAFFFGLLFFALFIIESSLDPLRDSQLVTDFMKSIDGNVYRGALSGGITTVIIQSSSATVGLAIAMAKENLLTGEAGLAVLLGAELGTCSNTLIATIRGTQQAIKTGLFHLLFNLMTILLGLLVFPYFVEIVLWLTPSQKYERIIANGHFLFNLSGVILFIPFVPFMERFLNFLIPDK
jgi:phosphate:Na+ symporter